MFRPNKKEKIILSVLGVLITVIWAPALFSGPRRQDRAASSPIPALTQAGAPGTEAAGSPAGQKGADLLGMSGWGENPFVADRGAGSSPALISNRGETGYALSGILWDAESPSAVINNQVVGLGDRLDQWQVMEIRKDRVVLSDGSSTQTLRVE